VGDIIQVKKNDFMLS
jgi:hypothetical protein